ncbi:hypothetical protein NDK43_03665 [Neobacillus pocheonensis]|uniref:Uncharacterized protein n=1 Tax=Neobacillus pocheonensis TaxID=363869 RepID=A0ABT0W5Q4_9BACI|nr:hypothetical protein [Neobacillus pocheonensis]
MVKVINGTLIGRGMKIPVKIINLKNGSEIIAESISKARFHVECNLNIITGAFRNSIDGTCEINGYKLIKLLGGILK